MRLTKKKAIEISIELWEWLAETGNEYKWEWPKWYEYGGMESECPLCEYDRRKGGLLCTKCPLKPRFSSCYQTAYDEWENAESDKHRRIHATKFLEQLKQLSEDPQ